MALAKKNSSLSPPKADLHYHNPRINVPFLKLFVSCLMQQGLNTKTKFNLYEKRSDNVNRYFYHDNASVIIGRTSI